MPEDSLSECLSGEAHPDLGALGRLVEDGLGLSLGGLVQISEVVRDKAAPSTPRFAVSEDELEEGTWALALRMRRRGKGKNRDTVKPGDEDS